LYSSLQVCRPPRARFPHQKTARLFGTAGRKCYNDYNIILSDFLRLGREFMTGNPEKITKGEDHLGQSCIVCQGAIESEDEVVACPRCRSVHHVQCWQNKGGCGKTGCAQIAQAVKSEPPPGDGPPPPLSKKVIFGVVLGVAAAILAMILWPKPPDPAMGRTKIVFFGEADHLLTLSMTELAEDYNATSETIYIDLQLLPPRTMDTKLVVLIAANEAPDVMAVDDNRYRYFLEQDVLLPLGEDNRGETVYSVEHPAQLTHLVVWGATPHPGQALEVLEYFAANIPPADRDSLRELEELSSPFVPLQ